MGGEEGCQVRLSGERKRVGRRRGSSGEAVGEEEEGGQGRREREGEEREERVSGRRREGCRGGESGQSAYATTTSTTRRL